MILKGVVTGIHLGATRGDTPKSYTAYRILDMDGDGAFHRLMDYENVLNAKKGDTVHCFVNFDMYMSKKGPQYQLIMVERVQNGDKPATSGGRV